jgi:hypothetical protein
MSEDDSVSLTDIIDAGDISALIRCLPPDWLIADRIVSLFFLTPDSWSLFR